jgi:hypothetical protein
VSCLCVGTLFDLQRCNPRDAVFGVGVNILFVLFNCLNWRKYGAMSIMDEYLRFMAASKISFDYDDVLSTEKGKELAKRKMSDGNTVYIISARRSIDGMINTAKALGIPESRIYATGSNKAKVEKVKELGIQTHYDNNPDVIKALGSVGKLFTNG